LQLNNLSTARRFVNAAPAEHRGWEWQHFGSQIDGAQTVIDVGRRLQHAPVFAIGPDDGPLVVGCRDGELQWCDPATGRLMSSSHVHTAEITGLAFSADGKRLASASHDGEIRIWNAGSTVAACRLVGFSKMVDQLYFDRSGSRLIAT